MSFTFVRACLPAVLVAGVLTGAGTARAVDGCAPAAAGGDWRSYGADTFNTRTQHAPTAIDADTARELTVAFAMNTETIGDGGEFQSTPVVADGCVFVASTEGVVYALNADDGTLLWKHDFEIEDAGYAGEIVGAVAVHDGRVYVPVNRAAEPGVAALDQTTGTVLWETTVDTHPLSFINAGVVPFNGMIFAGISGGEASPRARGAFAILDGETGELLKHTYTIDDDEYAAGYGGVSVWSTAAIDPVSGYAFVGGGNPASKRLEHPYSNALLKIDVDPARATFGQIVDSYKGEVDQYYPGLDRQPACQYFGEHPDLQIAGVWSATCLQLDLDFGASPNLFVDSQGRQVVGALQKSGVYHAAYTGTMDRAWTAVVGTPCFACNAASSAFDGTQVIGVAVAPGQMYSLNLDNGLVNWLAPIGGGVHFQSTSTANGLAYTTDLKGTLDIIDTSTGTPVTVRDVRSDAGDAGGLTSSGVAIARDTLYVASGPVLVLYR